jgi:hypothetical protein
MNKEIQNSRDDHASNHPCGNAIHDVDASLTDGTPSVVAKDYGTNCHVLRTNPPDRTSNDRVQILDSIHMS